MRRCTSQLKINTHKTHDEASPQAANGPLRHAIFRPGSKAICKCQAGECAPDACDALYVLDAEGTLVATFHGADFRATDEENSGGAGLSGLCVYRMPKNGGTTRDENQLDLHYALKSLDRVTPAGEKALLGHINHRNAEFWRRRD